MKLSAPMQISAANLLIASQQAAKPAPRPEAGAFAAALATFEPLTFKQVSAPAPQATPAATAPLGSQIDIRV